MKQKKSLKKMSKYHLLTASILSSLSILGGMTVADARDADPISETTTLTADRNVKVTVDNVINTDTGIPTGAVMPVNDDTLTLDLSHHALNLNMDLNYNSLKAKGSATVKKYSYKTLSGIYASRGKTIDIQNVGATGVEINLAGPRGKELFAERANPDLFGIQLNDRGSADSAKGSTLNIDGDVKMKLLGQHRIVALQIGGKSDVNINGKLTATIDSLRGTDRDTFPNGQTGTFDQKSFFRYGLNIERANNRDNNPINVSIKEIDIRGVDKGIYLKRKANITIGGGILHSNAGNYYLNKLIENNGSIIYFGMNEQKDDAGKIKTELRGDILSRTFVSSKTGTDKGEVHLGLRGKDSSWRGAVDYANEEGLYKHGIVNLTMREGSHWENVATQPRTSHGSVINTLKSDQDSYIIQNDNKDLTIDKFKGSLTILYNHTGHGQKPEDFTAGNTIVKSAEQGSNIELLTGENGVDLANQEEIYQTLNNLAHKLIYEGYKKKGSLDGERNLMATVRMAEKLTMQGKTIARHPIDFDENTGKGILTRKIVGIIDPNTTSKIEAPIIEDNYYGNEVRKAWDKANSRKEIKSGKKILSADYTFNKDLILDVATGKQAFVDQSWHKWAFGAVQWSGDRTGSIDMTGHKLTLNASSNRADIDPSGIFVKSGTLNIKNVKGIEINSKSPNGQGRGIFVIGMNSNGSWSNGTGDAKLIIENDGKKENAVKVHVDAYDDMGAVEARGNTGTAEIDIKGLVDIESKKFRAVEASQGAKISIGGGIVKSLGNAALGALSGSTINVNAIYENGTVKPVHTDRDVQIIGGITSYNKATTNLALATKNSYFKGLPSLDLWGKDYEDGINKPLRGDLNLYMAEGSFWENEEVTQGAYVPQNGKQSPTPPAIVSQLVSRGGSIFQKDKRTITIDKLDGKLNLYYGHEQDGTKQEHYVAGDTHVKSATTNSIIHLYTDKNGIDMSSDEQLDHVLNALAGKLYYDAYKNGERHLTGTVGIAEGLTTASKTRNIKDLKFNETTGKAQIGEKDLGNKGTGGIATPEKPETTETIENDVKLTKPRIVKLSDPYAAPGIEPSRPSKPLTIDLNKKALTLDLANLEVNDGDFHAINVNGKLDIKNPGEKPLTIIAKAKDSQILQKSGAPSNISNGEVVGIFADNKGTVDIAGDVDMTLHGVGKVFAIRTEDNANVNIKGKLTVKEGNLTSICGTEWDNKPDAPKRGAKFIMDKAQLLRHGISVAKNANVNIDEVEIYAHDKGLEAKEGSTIAIGSGILNTTNKGGVAQKHLFDVIGGKVSFGMNKENTDATTKKVQLTGNIRVKNENGKEGIINIGLRGEDSFLHGSLDSVNDTNIQGTVNLHLLDGAHWTNETFAQRVGDGTKSRIKNLKATGATNYIFHKDKNDIVVDKFSGNTTVLYEHNARGQNPTDFTAGNFIIKSATPNSTIQLLTDKASLDTENQEELFNVFKNLANKLTYEGYKNNAGKTGERNLMGSLRIAETLTLKAKTIAYHPLNFDENTGQGFITRKDIGLIDPKTTDKIDAPIFEDNYYGKEVKKAWKESGTRTESTGGKKTVQYTFNKDLILDVGSDKKAFVDQSWHKWAFGAVQWSGDRTGSIDMTGHKLTLNASSNRADIDPSGIFVKSGTLNIKNVKGIEINSKSPNGQGRGIFVIGMNSNGTWSNGTGDAKLTIENDDKKENAVKVHVDAYDDMGAVEARGNTGTAEIDIKGLVDIESKKFRAVEASQGAKISIGGGIVKSLGNAALGALSGSTINVNATYEKGKVKPLFENRDVQIIGGITSYNKATTNLALTTKNSYFHGMPSLNLWGKDDQDGTIKPLRGDLNLYMSNGAYWINEETGQGAYVQKTRAKEENPAAIVSQLVSKGGVIIQKDKRSLTLDKMEGYVKLFYGHEQDGTAKEHYKAGDTHIKTAEKNSTVYLYTDRNGIDVENKEQLQKVFNSLATKLYYDAYKDGEKNLKGKVGIAETLTANSKTQDITDLTFNSTTGQAQINADKVKPLPKPDPNPNPPAPTPEDDTKEETAVIKSTKTAIFSSTLLWNTQNNDLQKRLGDLRLLSAERGAWGKYQGGSTSLDAKDSKNQKVQGDQKYHGVQIGYDKNIGTFTVGAALGYTKNDDTYLTGTGKGTTISAALYASKINKDGSYLDIIAKTGNIKNDYDVKTREYDIKKDDGTSIGDRIKGTYKGTGLLLSMEYGKRLQKTGSFYLEPSIELTYSSVGSYDQTILSEKRHSLKVHANVINSFVTKLGVSVGQQTEKMNFYGKLSLAHEFGGDIATNYTDFSEKDASTIYTDVQMKDTWLDLELGTNYKMSDNSYFYSTFSKNFGAKLENKWRLDAGLRFAL